MLKSVHEVPREVKIARYHMAASMLLLFASSLWLLWKGVSVVSLYRVIPLVAMGSFTLLIMGTQRMLLNGIAKIKVAGTENVAALSGSLCFSGSLGAFIFWDFRFLFSLLWSLAMIIHISTVGLSLLEKDPNELRKDRNFGDFAAIGILHIAAPIYGLVSAIIFPIAYSGAFPVPAAHHILLQGFISGTIAGVSMTILPRFTEVNVPRNILQPIAALLSIGPAFVAAGFFGNTASFALGALMEAAGLIALGLSALYMIATSRYRKPSFYSYAFSAISVITGAFIGFLFTVGYTNLVPAHGFLNLYGFVAMMMFGAVIDMYSPAIIPSVPEITLQFKGSVSLAVLGITATFTSLAFGNKMLGITGLTMISVAATLFLIGATSTLKRMR
ncbi:MAG: hypothetical protein HZB68_01200 [Candidatus Aenigmarchaeota archaeon]|nr:hypothetical protein [Candidatus Aenigmarchaeota archaeon]